MPNSSIVFSHSNFSGLDAYEHTGYVADLGGAGSKIWDNKAVSSGVTIDGVDFDPDVMLWGLL